MTGSGGVVKGPHSGVWEASRVALWARLGVEPGDGASHVGVLLAEGSSSEAKRLYYGGGAHLRGKDTNLRVFPQFLQEGNVGALLTSPPAH